MQTLGSVLEKKGGISSGFDFLRVFLALGIVFVHSFGVSQGKEHSLPQTLISLSIVPMFIALSGFLVTRSAQRLRTKDFILNRAYRILPAFTVDVCIGAIIIGGIFTTLPLYDYYTSGAFLSYFINVIGLIHYELPGVFKDNPYPDVVNGNLWTIPFEIGGYLLMAGIMLLGILHRRHYVAVLMLALTGLLIWSMGKDLTIGSLIGVRSGVVDILDKALLNYTAERGRLLYIYFMMGSLFYLYREKLPYSWPLFSVALVIFLYQAFTVPEPTLLHKLLYIPLVTYLMAFIGVSHVPELPLFKHGDYSYGIYLYGFPIQQAVAATVLPDHLPAWGFFLVSVAVLMPVAMFSWHCVEKPMLSLRKHYSFTAHKGDGHHF